MTEPIAIDARDGRVDAHINALRGTAGDSHDPGATQRRILSTLGHRKRRRHQLVAAMVLTCVGLPLGTTAYAAYFGTPAVLVRAHAWLVEVGVASPPVPGAHAKKHAAPHDTMSTAVAATTPTANDGHVTKPIGHPAEQATTASRMEPAIESTTQPATQPTTSPTTQPTTTQTQPNPAATSSTPRSTRTARSAERPRPKVAAAEPTPVAAPPDPSEALYTRAHELHFVARDWRAALDAWDRYLTRAPNPTLLLEAKYNRALCLVRLKRADDAIAALTPFSEGVHGDYRKREASALIQALRSR